MAPWISPSHMNGTRMNQLVAPTSFMTWISRRRAKVARRMVFTIRNSDEASSTPAMAKKRPRIQRMPGQEAADLFLGGEDGVDPVVEPAR